MKRTVLLALVALVLSAPAARAVTWTEIPSGTTSEITAIEYQGPNRFWFTTSDGAIFKRQPDGTFSQVLPPNSIRLNDIEFQDGGNIGLAAGESGKVWRSQDAGDNWTLVTGIMVSKRKASSTFPDCSATEPLGTVNHVRFVNNDRVWIFAEGSQLARSQPATVGTVGATGTWNDANRAGDNTCKVDKPGSLYNDGLADGFFAPANPNVGYIVHGSYGYVFNTTDNLATTATFRPAAAGNTGGPARTLAGDPANPSRMWSVNPTPYGLSTTGYTEDGFATANPFRIVNDTYRTFPANGPYDVDYRGGTVLAAGDSGLILTSVNGKDFYYADDKALAGQDWRAVSLADATNAAVGGKAGKLIVSTDANATPDTTPPTGTISGPDSGTPGQPLTFTATLADEAGGSGINAAATKWTTPGLPDQGGNPATFTFPNAGTYTITLTFADNAGNTATASKSVTVGSTSGQRPSPVLPGSSKPPLVGGAAKKKGKYVVFRVKGRLGLPAGVTAKQGCNGTMSISVYRGKKRLAAKRTSVKANCRYKRTVRVKRRKVGKAKRLKLKVAFKGNSFLAPLSSTYKAKVK